MSADAGRGGIRSNDYRSSTKACHFHHLGTDGIDCIHLSWAAHKLEYRMASKDVLLGAESAAVEQITAAHPSTVFLATTTVILAAYAARKLLWESSQQVYMQSRRLKPRFKRLGIVQFQRLRLRLRASFPFTARWSWSPIFIVLQ